MRTPASIQKLRRRIDALDRRLVKLLCRRARCSLAVGRLKQRADLPLFHHAREREIAANVRRSNRGPLPDRAIEHLFEVILQHTRATVRAALRAERRRTPFRKSR
jgi:chorismate mutase